jgi:hypothetical protein
MDMFLVQKLFIVMRVLQSSGFSDLQLYLQQMSNRCGVHPAHRGKIPGAILMFIGEKQITKSLERARKTLSAR